MVFLSSVWFGDAPSNERTDKMTEYLINSGAYGLQKNLQANRFLLENINRHDTGRRKLLYFIKTVFPGKRYMGRRYSAIKKFSALLPVFWVVRWFQTLFGSIGSIRYRLVSVAETSENILEDSGFNPKEKNR